MSEYYDRVSTWHPSAVYAWAHADDWMHRTFPDGVEQWRPYRGFRIRVFIERVVGPGSRRKQWYIVDRRPPERWRSAKYPPKISGPYKTLDGAKAAYLMMRHAGVNMS